jgi:hypothetical protein
MPCKRHSVEKIVAKLRLADVLLAQGQMGGGCRPCAGYNRNNCAMNCLVPSLGAGQGAAFTCSS